MRKLLFVLLLIGMTGNLYAIEVGTFVDKSGLQYVRDLVTLSDGSQAYREISANGIVKLRNLSGQYINPKGVSIVNPTPTPTPTPSPTPTPGPSVVGNVVQGGAGLLAVAAGVTTVADGLASETEKKNWNDFAHTVAGTTAAFAGGAAFVNAIPVGGQLAYGVAITVGALSGAAMSGAQIFSETDCERDPVTGQYACCNISNLSNIQARRVNIGDEMFAEFPMVRTCVQGKKEFTTEQPWLKGRFLDDHWSKSAKVKYCTGWVEPENPDDLIQAFGSSDEEGKVCWQWECAESDMVRNGGKCVPDTSAPNPTPAPGGGTGSKCRAQRAGADWSDRARACCDLPKSVAEVVGKEDCNCLEPGKSFQIVAGRGVCVDAAAGAPVPGGFTCPAEDSILFNSYRQRCVNNAEALKAIADLENACATKQITNKELYQALKDVVWLYVQECGAAPAVVQPNDDGGVSGEATIVAQRIRSSYEVLQDLIADFDVTVWRNEEGKFNTARLASDSIAGVVLGTAGGLISSNVIKKSQIKNGLEDIQCTVGGQVVGSFGDEFRVGIQ